MITAKCDGCGKAYKLPDEAAGKKAKCKSCGEVMAIPAASAGAPPADDPLGLGGGPKDPAKGDLASLYGDPGDEPTAPGVEPVAFNPAVSFKNEPSKRSGGQLPVKVLALAGGGAALLLVVVVVLIVVIGGGGGDDDGGDDGGAGGLAIQGGTGAIAHNTSPIERQTPNSNQAGDQSDTNAAPNDEGNDTQTSLGNPTNPDVTGPDVVPDPSDDVDPDGATAKVEGLGLTGPTNKPFGIELPEGFEIASKSRVAVRTKPLEDGTWLSLEVHKLSGLERRAASPVASAQGTILMRGARERVPSGAELSELSDEPLTVHRMLYPEPADKGVRRVVYVMKDGPHLITVLGRYPTDQPDRLAELDKAALSVRARP